MSRYASGAPKASPSPRAHARRRCRPAALAAGAALVLAAAAAASAPGCTLFRHSRLKALPAATLVKSYAEDAGLYRDLDAGLARAVALLADHPGLFAPDADRVLKPDEEPAVLDAWVAFVDSAFALDLVRGFYEDYWRFDRKGAEAELHVRCFLLTFAAELSLYEHTAAVIDLLEENDNVETFLDLARPDRHLPADSVAALKEELAGLSDLTRVVAGRAYLRDLLAKHDARRLAEAGGYAWLLPEIERHLHTIEARRADGLATVSIAADFAPIRRAAKHLTFPVQAEVAEWMGDTRVKRVGRYLVNAAQLDGLRAAAAPGDVMLARKNWYLSNVGLPGFWPHALMYVGDAGQLATAFDADAATAAWVEAKAGRPMKFTDYLAATYPAAWTARAAAGEGHEALLVIEAVSEGVLQNNLEHAGGDYIAVLRPRLPARVRAEAIDRAFSYLGRPYDFDFDFATDTTLVCTELVWRAYRAHDDVPGLTFTPIPVAGRLTLPANEIARKYAAEHGRPDAQLDLVLYLEGREDHVDAVVADEAAFLATPDRSKWDFDQP
ncbi:MAG TPA: YiiX/YebB-like N1pC/P60 family cysteine hydrolase [Myxococcota bacterium]|jgi:hypothetical protein|nr:YiiX/YebB-like N1pC/P60 family cysteine hydrolase [Myxococcota bacterium]